ncbi:hypothetical protein K438DRAFT_1760087 [Mycena galopus ATCC 62051]|nr:hypothetical protein K438DRAFT_1760087 [Mycena galopus ATCC 62051]
MPDVPCPYLMFLMASAWCVDLEVLVYGAPDVDNPQSMEAVFPSRIVSWRDTWAALREWILPITSCLRLDLESDVEVEDHVPLSAEQYCSAYYPVPEETGVRDLTYREMGVKEDVLKNIDALRHWTRLQSFDHRNKSTMHRRTPHEILSPIRLLLPNLLCSPLPTRPSKNSGWASRQNLADLMKPILQAQSPLPDSAMPLLTKIVQHEGEKKSLDRSGFSLSNSQFISLLTSTGAESVEVLKFSHNPITTDTCAPNPSCYSKASNSPIPLSCLSKTPRSTQLSLRMAALASGVHEEEQSWSSRYGFLSILDTKFSLPKMGAGLEEMAAEGRPSASDAAVRRLEKIFADLTEKKKVTVWTEADFLTCKE